MQHYLGKDRVALIKSLIYARIVEEARYKKPKKSW